MVLEKFSYKIYPEYKLIIRYYRGTFSIPDLIHTLEKTGMDSLYDPSYNVINDFREARSTVNIGEINKFFGYIKNHKKLYGKRKSVYLTTTPNKSVFRMMTGLLKNEKLIAIKTFSTLEEAIIWLDLPISELGEFDTFIMDLKNQ